MTARIDRRFVLAALAAGLLFAPKGLAQALAGRRIAFLIGNEGSGGYERYARLFAEFLAAALPDARVSVETVTAADGRLAAKRIAEAPAGDLVIGLFETALLYSEIESDDMAPISLGDFRWIGKLAVDERILIAGPKSGFRTLEDLRNSPSPAVFPASTVVSRSSSECYLLNAIAGLPIRPVPGYDGGQRALALLSGEASVVVGSYPSQKKLIAQGATPLLRLNQVPSPATPGDVPLLRDLADPRYADIVDFLELSNNLGRWIAAPPSIPDAELATLRAAFDAIVVDPEFLARAAKEDLAIDALSGAEVEARLSALLARKPQLRASLSAALACGRLRAEGARSC